MAYYKNIANVLQDSEMFGLGWLGDGATIKQTPLINILVMCGNIVKLYQSLTVPPTCVKEGKKMQHISWKNLKCK